MGAGKRWVQEATFRGVRWRTGADQQQNRRRVTTDSVALFGAFLQLISQICNIFESLMWLDAAQTPSWGSNHNMRRHTALSAPLCRASNCCLTEAHELGEFTVLLLSNTWHNQFGFRFHFAAITVKQDTTWPCHQTNGETPGHCGLWLTFAKMWELAHTQACAHIDTSDFPPSLYNLLRLPSHFHAGAALTSNPIFYTHWLSSR